MDISFLIILMSDFRRCGVFPPDLNPTLGVRCGLLLLGGRGLWKGGGVAMDVSSSSRSWSWSWSTRRLAIMVEAERERAGEGCLVVCRWERVEGRVGERV